MLTLSFFFSVCRCFRRIPPKTNQGLLQGGLFCFDGEDCVFSHKDRATGDHADFEKALRALGI